MGFVMNVVEITEQLVRPVTDKLGLILWDVEFKKEGADFILRVSIDKDEGVSITDCENVSNELNPLLDEADPIQDAYYLEVSSPGVERVLRTMEHFSQCVGQKAQIKLYKAIDGRKSLIGIITECDKEDTVAIAEGDKVTEIPLESIAKANIVFDFE